MLDLRDEIGDEALADAIKSDFRTAPVEPRVRLLLEYGDKLTRRPQKVSRADIKRLREAGWTDGDLLDAAEVVAYFNYINRLADGLGVEPEDFMPPRPSTRLAGR